MPTLKISSPTIVHHMAALDGQSAPQNSLAAIQNCLQAGAEFIEVDITALADGDYLLVHDAELREETSGEGPVGEATADQARRLFIRQRGIITEHRAALLSDVVRLFQDFGGSSRLQLDFKNAIPFTSDEPLQRLVNIISPLRQRAGVQPALTDPERVRAGVQPALTDPERVRVLVSSGADWQLRRLRTIAPWLPLGFDVMWYIAWQPSGEPRDPRDFPKQLGAYGYYDDHLLATERHWPAAEYLRDRCESLMALVPDVSVFYLEHLLIDQSLNDGFNWAEALHQRGIKLDAWTMDITSPVAVENAPRLLEAGVDLFTTNTPTAMAELLKNVISH